MTFSTSSQILVALLAIFVAMESISANDYCKVAENNIMCKFKVGLKIKYFCSSYQK